MIGFSLMVSAMLEAQRELEALREAERKAAELKEAMSLPTRSTVSIPDVGAFLDSQAYNKGLLDALSIPDLGERTDRAARRARARGKQPK